MVLDGKTVMISGVGPGLGGACADAAFRDGANVVLVARNQERLDGKARELDPTGDRVLAVAADISERVSLDAAVDAAVAKFGRLDGVVSVAAFDNLLGRVLDTDPGDFEAVLRLNVIAPVALVDSVTPALEGSGGGSIVLIGSQASLNQSDRIPQGAYGASKSALLAVARSLAVDLGPRKIRVNTVVPTWMWGPNVELYCQWQAGERGTTTEAIRDEIVATMPLGEMPTDGDVAEAVIFFLSDRSRMVTGQRILVNAGEFFDT